MRKLLFVRLVGIICFYAWGGDTTFQYGANGYSSTYDAMIANFTSNTFGTCDEAFATGTVRSLFRFDVTLTASTVDSARLYLYQHVSNGGGSNIKIAIVRRNWAEGDGCNVFPNNEVTWSNASSVAWGTAGCNSVPSDRSDWIDTQTTVNSGWVGFDVTKYFRDVLIDDSVYYGFVLDTASSPNGNTSFRTKEYTTSTYRPYVRIYTDGITCDTFFRNDSILSITDSNFSARVSIHCIGYDSVYLLYTLDTLGAVDTSRKYIGGLSVGDTLIDTSGTVEADTTYWYRWATGPHLTAWHSFNTLEFIDTSDTVFEPCGVPDLISIVGPDSGQAASSIVLLCSKTDSSTLFLNSTQCTISHQNSDSIFFSVPSIPDGVYNLYFIDSCEQHSDTLQFTKYTSGDGRVWTFEGDTLYVDTNHTFAVECSVGVSAQRLYFYTSLDSSCTRTVSDSIVNPSPGNIYEFTRPDQTYFYGIGAR
jgi:hypothetical protein